ncbi:NAD(P)H-flavin reductase/hemoglobin-like flavoprotein [Nocardioides ginsengisegetis]|uniref:nitric oxide dioxygenase n=1 Tax=Nocardioides ginsengisegetis TaxID=661491 RepID=A0A7W3P8K6_9ACTN|nr:globin domain-containing protein [Nocardioides ginsengisegetis]MBA8802529.1 NAD(P)H-flavin reductase/hemoglobin-like flavoprotein [Nocardioides ginsengisegetis]
MDTVALQRSWDQVTKHGHAVPLYFYSHLFLAHPEVRSMFPLSMANQRDKLVSALGRVVSHVDQLETDEAFLQHLARDHRKYGVITEHYNAVGASLCATLAHFLGDEWDEDLAADWAMAYQVIARIMVEAADMSQETTPDFWDADVVKVERRMMDLTLVRLQPKRELKFLPGQSLSMEIPQRPRLWRYFSPANAPRQDWSIDLHVQQIDGGQVSTALTRSLKAGDTVKLGAPVGERLTRTENDPTDLLMVAGGTGLAPLRGVLEQIDREWQRLGAAPRVHLLHGVRMPWHLYDRKVLRELAKDRPWFEYTEVVSDDPSFPGTRGKVGSIASRQHLGGRTAMVCGGPQMVAHTLEQLTAAGMPTEQIKYEHFYYAAASEQNADAALNEQVS